jgi:hypothetical protein
MNLMDAKQGKYMELYRTSEARAAKLVEALGWIDKRIHCKEWQSEECYPAYLLVEEHIRRALEAHKGNDGIISDYREHDEYLSLLGENLAGIHESFDGSSDQWYRVARAAEDIIRTCGCTLDELRQHKAAMEVYKKGGPTT